MRSIGEWDRSTAERRHRSAYPSTHQAQSAPALIDWGEARGLHANVFQMLLRPIIPQEITRSQNVQSNSCLASLDHNARPDGAVKDRRRRGPCPIFARGAAALWRRP